MQPTTDPKQLFLVQNPQFYTERYHGKYIKLLRNIGRVDDLKPSRYIVSRSQTIFHASSFIFVFLYADIKIGRLFSRNIWGIGNLKLSRNIEGVDDLKFPRQGLLLSVS